MTCECCKQRQARLRRKHNRRYYLKVREEILAAAKTPEARAKRRAYARDYYLKNSDRVHKANAEHKRRRRAEKKRARQGWKAKAPEINADRRSRQVSKWRKYREAEKRDSRIIMPPWQSAAALLARLQEHHA